MTKITLVLQEGPGDYYFGQAGAIYADGEIVWSDCSADTVNDICVALLGEDGFTLVEDFIRTTGGWHDSGFPETWPS